MKERYITGLDIGSLNIRVVVGQFNPQDNGIYIVGVGEASSEGISKGTIISIEEAVSSVTACLEQAERVVGQPINKAYVGISGTHIHTSQSKGVVAVSRSDGEIKEDDVERAIEASQTIATPPNNEILHVIPRTFTVDSQMGIKDPIGMTGIRLEVETQIIQGLSSQIKNLTKTIYRTGLDIEDLVFSILACAETTLTKRQKELGVLLLNIGHSTTSLAVFEEGDVLLTQVLPIGSAHITSDIAIGLRTSLDIAESIKLEYGHAIPDEINKREEIDLAEFSSNEEGKVSIKYVSEIIQARLEEIFSMVDKELISIERSGLLPAGVILTGGGSKMPGIIDIAKKEFRLPASIGKPLNINTTIDKVNDPEFTTAVGLVLWGSQLHFHQTGKISLPHISSVGDVSRKVKKWVKSIFK